MSEEWIVLVEGREYGPVDLSGLREWKGEGRVLPTNQARRAEADVWIKASEIPGLFEGPVQTSETSVVPSGEPRRLGGILGETFRIYGKGFFQFLGLRLLVTMPLVCAQLIGTALNASPALDGDFKTLLSVGFGLCMILLTCAAWPLYISGIQILATELHAGRRVGFLSVLNEAVKYWSRVAVLCICVYGVFFLLIVLALVILVMVLGGGSSLLVIFLALTLLVFQIWMFGRWFANVLFWQQFAVIKGLDAVRTLHESKKLARSRRDLVWYKRPLWRGAFIVSLWIGFEIVLYSPLLWSSIRLYLQEFAVLQDPEALARAITTNAKMRQLNSAASALSFLMGFLRPLLGIAFVLLFLDATEPAAGEAKGRGD